jgi:hypothetical protein
MGDIKSKDDGGVSNVINFSERYRDPERRSRDPDAVDRDLADADVIVLHPKTEVDPHIPLLTDDAISFGAKPS